MSELGFMFNLNSVLVHHGMSATCGLKPEEMPFVDIYYVGVKYKKCMS